MKKLLAFTVLLFVGTPLFAQNNYVATSPTSATPGGNNAIIGISAGRSITDAQRNVILGNEAASANKSAIGNVYIGHAAAASDTSKGIGESVYIGSEVAFKMKKGDRNVLIGFRAGQNLNSTTGSTIMGYNAAGSLKGGFGNTLIGENAATSYTGLLRTVCLGQLAGTGRIAPSPTTGDKGTYIGFEAAGINGLDNATAIGAEALVTQSNSLILGSKGIRVGIGNTAPRNKLEITTATANQSGLRFTNLTASSNAVATNGKMLSVNTEGDVILTPSPNLTAVLSRLTTLEKANTDQTKQISALQKANEDLNKRIAILEGQKAGNRR